MITSYRTVRLFVFTSYIYSELLRILKEKRKNNYKLNYSVYLTFFSTLKPAPVLTAPPSLLVTPKYRFFLRILSCFFSR